MQATHKDDLFQRLWCTESVACDPVECKPISKIFLNGNYKKLNKQKQDGKQSGFNSRYSDCSDFVSEDVSLWLIFQRRHVFTANLCQRRCVSMADLCQRLRHVSIADLCQRRHVFTADLCQRRCVFTADLCHIFEKGLHYCPFILSFSYLEERFQTERVNSETETERLKD